MKTPIIKNVAWKITKKLFFICLSMFFTALVSCSNEDASPSPGSDEKETANYESQDDYYFSDADDIAEAAFVSEDEKATGGKISTDSELTGALLLRVGDFSNGSLHVDFGSGCTDKHGIIRKGLIIISHVGRWNEEGAQWTITFSGYTVNGVKIEGTRKVTVVSVTETSIVRDIELIGGKITWPDGSTATREGHHRREHDHDVSLSLNRIIVSGSAQGTLRNGKDFSVEILEDLIYDRACAETGVTIAVQGKKLVKHGDRELTIDYGDGTCDNLVTVTNKAGITVSYEIGKCKC